VQYVRVRRTQPDIPLVGTHTLQRQSAVAPRRPDVLGRIGEEEFPQAHDGEVSIVGGVGYLGNVHLVQEGQADGARHRVEEGGLVAIGGSSGGRDATDMKGQLFGFTFELVAPAAL